MSKNFKVEVEFSPKNESKLIDALQDLARAQDNLRKANHNLQISAERVNQAQLRTKLALERVTAASEKNAIAVEKLKIQKKTLQVRLDKANLALTRYRNGLKSTTRTGIVATRNNRLLSNSFATIRSTLLLASFGVGLVSSSFIRLASLAGEQKRVEDQLAVALGRTSQALLDQASALQQTTGFGDESIIAAQAQLAAFTDNEEAIKRLTVSTLDFATAQGMTLNEAAKLIGKTIGSTTNALSRYGVTVQGAVGSTERLDSAVAGIATLFADQATTRLLSFNGQLELAAGNIGDVGEDLGAELVPQLTIALTNFNKFALIIQNNSRAFEALQAGLKLGVVILSTYFIRLNAVRKLLFFIPNLLKNAFTGTGKLNSMVKASSTAFGLFRKRLASVAKMFKSGDKVGIAEGVKQGAKAFRLLDKRLITTGLQSLAATSLIGGLAAKFTGLRKSIEGVIDPSKIDNVVSNQTVKTKKELNMETAKYLELVAKETTALDKLNQKRFILASNTKVEENQRKALVKTIGELNKQSGLQIELGDIKNFQDLQNEIVTQDKLNLNEEEIRKAIELAKALFDLNMITTTGAISNAKANELRLQSMVDIGNAFSQINAGNRSAAVVAIRLAQIKAIADAYAAFNEFQSKGRLGLASLSLAKGLANAAIIEKQASKARAAATGADFVTQGFTRMTVGEEGAERVQVTPLGNNNRAAAGGMRNITVNIEGSVIGTDEFVRDVLIPSIDESIDRNLA
tara:strand:+ start:1954 stop:4185 length:2232 start_codon:yes stop_codon:yes gene_type:complete